jgi:hypothetical protein
MGNPTFLTQNLTSIHVDVTIALLFKLGGTTLGGGLLVKLASDGKLWKLLAGSWDFANRKYAESSINSTLRKLRKGGTLSGYEENLGKKIKYELQSKLAFDDLDEGESVLIALNSVKHTPSNITTAALQYVSKSLLPKASMTLESDLEKGITYVVCREAFTGQNMISARDYFDSKILPEEYAKNPKFELLMESLRKVQKFGLVTQIILQQFIELNKIDFETFEYSKIKDETKRFVEFVRKITEREESETSNLKFPGEFIKARVYFVSSSHQLEMGGVDHILNRIKKQVEFDYIFLICPAINKHLTPGRRGGRKDQFWKVYKNTLAELKRADHRFTVRKSEIVKAKNRRGEMVEIGISFLSRNY